MTTFGSPLEARASAGEPMVETRASAGEPMVETRASAGERKGAELSDAGGTLQHLQYACLDGVATITLAREAARNAYSPEMLASLEAALRRAETDAGVRVLVLTGTGRTFSAGGDLKEMAAARGMFAGSPAELLRNYEQGLQHLALSFDRLSKPVLAAMNGHAIGGGLTLACLCDIRICSAEARLGSTFVKLGLVPADGSTFVLPRTIGFSRALDLMLTGRIIDAAEAERIGLVDEVVPPDDVLARARAKAAMIASLPPVAVQLTKRACYSSARLALGPSLELVAGYQAIAQRTDEHFQAVARLLSREP